MPLGPFEEDPNIYAGKDTLTSGTWLGFNIKTGLLVFLTNYDLPKPRYGLSRAQMIKKVLATKFCLDEQGKPKSSEEVDTKIIQYLQSVLDRRM